MVRSSELLIAYGPFVQKAKQITSLQVGNKTYPIEGKTPAERLASLESIKKDAPDGFDKAVESVAGNEWAEVAKDQLMMTNYPKPIQRYFLGMDSWHQSIEPIYFWASNFLADLGFAAIDKITDIFTASEHSSFYGAGMQRLGLAQDKAAQFLAAIGKMIKDMFQLVRELRWIDERLTYYRGSLGLDKDDNRLKDQKQSERESAEVALKGLWVDLVDGVVGGQRTGANLFVMAQQLQFTTLPDLFFKVHPPSAEKVAETVDTEAKEFNEQVRGVLKRKLFAYMSWKQATYEEMKNRRTFTLNYLRQHYQVIKMYMNWVKPYLRHIERLGANQAFLESPRLIAAFESSMVEIEILARKLDPGNKDAHACILLRFEYFTKPSMQYTGDSGYHRGPVHVGATRITWRSYSWTKKQIDNFLAMKSQEDIELLTSIDKSLKDAMESLGSSLTDYLAEAAKAEPIVKKVEARPKQAGVLDPFAAIGKGTKELFGGLMPEIPKIQFGKKKPKGEDASGSARALCWIHYNIFKKAHGLLSW